MIDAYQEELSLEFRVAEQSDAQALLDYQLKVAKEATYLSHGPEDIRYELEQMEGQILAYQAHEQSIMVLACLGTQIIAFASLAGKNNSREAHLAELGITVLEEYQGMGIGSILMEMLIEFAQTTTLQRITLEVALPNDPAIHLYEKFGFEHVALLKERLRVKNEFVDTLIMDFIL